MLIFLLVMAVAALAVFFFMRSPRFGKLPSRERLALIKKSPNYNDGRFVNLHFTPQLAEGVSMLTVMRKFFFEKNPRSKPPGIMPSRKTNLLALNAGENVLVWFGHSSYFIQADGKKILVDPVFSGGASPLSFTTRAFAGSDVYSAADMPEIDYLVITHDHWDHLDYATVVKLEHRVKQVITGLGTGAHLERWGYDKNKIIEKDWNEEAVFSDGFSFCAAPARHFSGRTFKRNTSLWASFILATPTMKLFLGGDSGYDTHFTEIGNKHGPFDLAILENGQYNPYWKYIHMMPEEVVKAGLDLKAKRILPVHWGKFTLSLHDWDEPIKRIRKEAERNSMPLIHPMIGGKVNLRNPVANENWWEKLH